MQLTEETLTELYMRAQSQNRQHWVENARTILAAHSAGAQTHKIIDDGEVVGYVVPSIAAHPAPQTDAVRDARVTAEMVEVAYGTYLSEPADRTRREALTEVLRLAEIERLDRAKGE